MSNIVVQQAEKLASTLSIAGSGADLINTLKATAFKGNVSDAQMTALLIVAQQYGLSPWTKEIYAFPDKNNGIVPVVGVDGWSRIINTHPQFDGMDFEQDDEACTCVIYRKDRNHPIKVTEWMSECKRGTGPWQSHPKRMLRHKAMIQCARVAFGYGGIYDQDEAERIVEDKPAQSQTAADSAEWIDPRPYLDGVDDMKTDAEALAYWKTNNPLFLKQPQDHAALKQKVQERRTALREAQVTDVEPKDAMAES